MPNISAHMAVAKRVGDILKINDDKYIIGNVLPDLYSNKRQSHYKKMGKKYMIPNIDQFLEEHDLNDGLYLGYLVHLLLDKYYLEDYLSVKIPDIDVFKNNMIYKDYNILNKDIVKEFDLDVDYITKVLESYKGDFDNQKMELNIRCLHFDEKGVTQLLDKNEFIEFLKDVPNKIVEDINNTLKDK